MVSLNAHCFLLPEYCIKAARLCIGLSYRESISHLLFVLYTGFLSVRVSASSWHSSCTEHAQIISLPTCLPWSHLATLLKVAPLFDQHLLESMLFLVRVLFLAVAHSQLPVPPSGTLYLLMFATLLARLSFALNLKLTSFSLFMALNSCPASMCTSELCKEGIIKLQLYCIVLYHMHEPTQRRSQPSHG